MAIDRAEAAAGATVLVLQPGPHGLVERLAIHALERSTEHPASIEESEGQIPLLHAARIALRVHLRQQLRSCGTVRMAGRRWRQAPQRP
jgi:hypothetical protein